MRIRLNDGWEFAKLHEGSTLQDAASAEFQSVDLPHDWLIWQADNLYETADVWYRRDLEADPSAKVTMLYFEGVYMDCDILLNDRMIESHPYGYTSFFADLTGKLNDGKNRIMVHIRHKSPNSRWYSGSGIYRNVWLLKLPEDYLVPDSLYITQRNHDGNWKLTVSAECKGRNKQRFSCRILNSDGETAAETEGRTEGAKAFAETEIINGETWSPDHPKLYKLICQYGKQTEVLRFGLREIRLDPESGFFLNGKSVKLHGVCLHHDLGALGAAFHEKAAKRQLELMKKMGVNAIRTSHNPPAPGFLDLCDEMGMLVVDEAFDMWERSKTTFDYARFFSEWHERDVAAWVRRDRCHPCVIMWSVGNEIYDMHADLRGTEITEELARLVRSHDPDRHAAVTFGCNYMAWEGGQRCADHVDAVGYNYGEKLYSVHHRQHPAWVIYGSETGSMLSSRGIYHFPIEQSIMSEADEQCSSLGNSNTSWGASDLKTMLTDDRATPYSMGQFVWSGIDYIGEPTPYHTRSCYFGQADTACFPKDSYYLFKSFWNREKMIHIGVSWDWNRGEIIDVPVMTNCHSAVLLLNGRIIGETAINTEDPNGCVPVWKIPFEPGMLKAEGYDAEGNVICTDEKATPGDTVSVRLTSENEYLLSDGWDLAFITAEAVDAKNRPVENARDLVKINVSGGGYLIGTDNGDSTDRDGYKSNIRRLFSGKLLIIIASNGSEDDVHISVESGTAGKAELTLPVRKAEPVQGQSHCLRIPENDVNEKITARRIDITAMNCTELTKKNPECTFGFRLLPGNASPEKVRWEITNAAGVEAPFVSLKQSGDTVTVHVEEDGKFYLRALCENKKGKTDFISQLEFSAAGFGKKALNPYEYISASLYDMHEGEIGTGNEKGIAFSRGDVSMAGYSRIDFGKAGTDRITADIFALNDDLYEIELLSGNPDTGLQLIDTLRYQKKSIWNVFQSETWQLPVRLEGIQSLWFRMKDKVHMRGFIFEEQDYTLQYHTAASAEKIYGDSFERDGSVIRGIGNNVTLSWEGFNFRSTALMLEIEGETDLPVQTVTVKIKNRNSVETIQALEFTAGKRHQAFEISVPEGEAELHFVFLPGSSFDFYGFRFQNKNDNA